MASKHCSGCDSTHEPPLNRICPFGPGSSDTVEEEEDTGRTQASNTPLSGNLVSKQVAVATANQVSDSGIISNERTEQSM